VAAAVAVVAALSLLTVTVMSSIGDDDDNEQAILDVEDSTTTTTTVTRRIPPRPTTTTTNPPEVLGDTTEREPDASTTTVSPAPTSTTAASTPARPSQQTVRGPAPAPPTPTTTRPPTATTTTTVPCRNSTDPSCGQLTWDPERGAYQVEVHEVSIPLTGEAGEPVRFAVDYVDRAGPDARGACVNWSAPGAETNISSCEIIDTDCARTGPHDPPPPSEERIPVAMEFVFPEPGVYEVTVSGNLATHLADACPSPWGDVRMDPGDYTYTIEIS
jgi:hypothetical protein